MYTVFGGPADYPDDVVIATNVLALETPFCDVREASGFLFDGLPLMLRQLRYVSRYARFPTDLKSAFVKELQRDDVAEIKRPSDRKSAAIGGFNLEAALTAEAIREFADLPVAYVAPVHSDLLLDAIAALALSDFKKSIIFAAIAVETMRATVLDEEYERLRSSAVSNAKYRFVERSSTPDAAPIVDPVYEAMRKSRRSQLRPLLDELPLYILGRSLLIDHKDLYDRMIALHRKRSEIAHSGETELLREGSPASQEWIAATIRDVAKVFEWFGISGRYPVLDQAVFLGQGGQASYDA